MGRAVYPDWYVESIVVWAELSADLNVFLIGNMIKQHDQVT